MSAHDILIPRPCPAPSLDALRAYLAANGWVADETTDAGRQHWRHDECRGGYPLLARIPAGNLPRHIGDWVERCAHAEGRPVHEVYDAIMAHERAIVLAGRAAQVAERRARYGPDFDEREHWGNDPREPITGPEYHE